MRVLIRGAGDIATGVALRLYRSHMEVVMTDLPAPTAIRRTVCFSQAIVLGRTVVEDVTAAHAANAAEAEALLAQGIVPVLADPTRRWTPFWPSGIWARPLPTRRWLSA